MSADGMQPGAGFEGGWRADGLADDAKVECGVCWRPYDAAIGDPARDIAPGTPFRALPDNWHCPECDSEKEKFLLVEAGAAPKRAAAGPDMQMRIDTLLQAYRDADLAMASLPIYNPALKIAAFGFRPHGDWFVGALVTPWFLNLVLLPKAKQRDARASGATRAIALPSGTYEASNVSLDGVGGFEFISLFSPMQAFQDQAAARIAAQAAIEAAFTPATPPTPEPPKDGSRRTLLFGRRRAEADSAHDG
jgi:[NiFe] hydrogenase assembly HybE family chaperone